MLTPDQINWKFSGHITQCGQGIRGERDIKLGLAKEIVTRLNEEGIVAGKAKTYYFISGDQREFRSEQDLCDAYNQLQLITELEEHWPCPDCGWPIGPAKVCLNCQFNNQQ